MPTWDQLKQRRDGTTAPLVTTIDQPAGEAAYIRTLRQTLQRLKTRRNRCDERVQDAEKAMDKAETALAECEKEIASIEEELEGFD